MFRRAETSSSGGKLFQSLFQVSERFLSQNSGLCLVEFHPLKVGLLGFVEL